MEVKHISAKAGNPSTFWKGESGNWYVTKKAALKDNTSFAVNPEAYKIKKSFYYQYQTQIILVLAVVGCCLAVYTAYKFKDKLFPKLPINM